MAARLRKTHQEDIRAKIQVSALITRLHDYAMGELSDEDVSTNRLNAIKLLLSKTLPDLQSIEHTGKDGADLIPETDALEVARRVAFILRQGIEQTKG